MTAGFGVDKGADGSGTNSSDIRKIFGGLYSPGVISGCEIVLSPTAMTYTVKPGVVAIQTAVGEVVLAPVAETTVSAANGPATESRTDIVYVQQRYPSIEGDANLVVGVATSLPPRALKLRKYIVPAGATKSNLGVASDSIDYSIPYGASLGILHQFTNAYDGAMYRGIERKGHGTISLPTDRKLRFSIQSCLSSAGAVNFDNSKYCEYGFLPNIDGNDFVLWSSTGLHTAWATFSFEAYIDVAAGEHTVMYGGVHIAGPGTVYQHYGAQGGWWRQGTVFTVEDVGPIV